LKFAHSEYSDLGNVVCLQGAVCSVLQWDDREAKKEMYRNL
jgi:hypothetical protein